MSDDWNINKPLSDGGAIMWAIAQGMNEDYSRKLSYHTRKGKAGKAKEGYSNGIPMTGIVSRRSSSHPTPPRSTFARYVADWSTSLILRTFQHSSVSENWPRSLLHRSHSVTSPTR